MYLWHAPYNNISVWFSKDNLRRCEIGWSDLKGKRDNYSFWWAILGFSGGVVLQSWPWQKNPAEVRSATQERES